MNILNLTKMEIKRKYGDYPAITIDRWTFTMWVPPTLLALGGVIEE